MEEIILTYEQNIKSALIFLNIFGLTIENKSPLFLNAELKIWDEIKQEVGKVHLEQNQVVISASTALGRLEAQYDYVKAKGLVDNDNLSNMAFFAQWTTNIFYSIIRNENTTITGDLALTCFLDTQLENKCSCTSSLRYQLKDQLIIDLKLQQGGKMFALEVKNGDELENIYLRPFDSMNGFIEHITTKGPNNSCPNHFEYHEYASVYPKEEQIETLIYTKKFGNTKNYIKNCYDKEGKSDSKRALIQMGTLMQKIDPQMYETIQLLRSLLVAGNVSLLDNLITACYSSYSNQEILALLGLIKKKLIYQNKKCDLTKAYLENPTKVFQLNK